MKLKTKPKKIKKKSFTVANYPLYEDDIKLSDILERTKDHLRNLEWLQETKSIDVDSLKESDLVLQHHTYNGAYDGEGCSLYINVIQEESNEDFNKRLDALDNKFKEYEKWRRDNKKAIEVETLNRKKKSAGKAKVASKIKKLEKELRSYR